METLNAKQLSKGMTYHGAKRINQQEVTTLGIQLQVEILSNVIK